MEIANVEAALLKVRTFIGLLDASYAVYNEVGSYSAENLRLRDTDRRVQEQFPLIARIAKRADPGIATRLQEKSLGWPYYEALAASQQLAGLPGSREEEERILGPVGPKLAAANLHPWVWNAAVNLWDDGHLREAVQAAATALFDHHLPAKLGVPGPTSSKDRISQAFQTAAPAAGKPRLRLDDYPDGSANWTSQHEGAQFFGMGCAQLIRNLATHTGAQPDEQDALEQLAALSMLARLIEPAKVVS